MLFSMVITLSFHQNSVGTNILERGWKILEEDIDNTSHVASYRQGSHGFEMHLWVRWIRPRMTTLRSETRAGTAGWQ